MGLNLSLTTVTRFNFGLLENIISVKFLLLVVKKSSFGLFVCSFVFVLSSVFFFFVLFSLVKKKIHLNLLAVNKASPPASLMVRPAVLGCNC